MERFIIISCYYSWPISEGKPIILHNLKQEIRSVVCSLEILASKKVYTRGSKSWSIPTTVCLCLASLFWLLMDMNTIVLCFDYSLFLSPPRLDILSIFSWFYHRDNFSNLNWIPLFLKFGVQIAPFNQIKGCNSKRKK